MKKLFINKSNTVLMILAIIFAVIFLTPFIIMITGSIQDKYVFVGIPSEWFKPPFTLKNFRAIFSSSGIVRWFFNSVIISVIPTLTTVFISGLMGYVFAKKDFYGKKILTWLFLAMIMVPLQSYVIPRYILFEKLGWINTYWAFIIPWAWDIMYFFLLRQHMDSIPDALLESAKIDGASEWQIFIKIAMPVAKTTLTIVAVFTFISKWNNLFYPLLFTTSSDMYPMSVGLASLLSQGMNFSLEMASTLINFIPTFVFFLILRKYFVQGISTTGMKG